MFDMNNEKIDIVYTWVDGNDAAWRAKRDYWAREENINILENDECRYIDNDELKYSLRSLEKYAPWINKVFIVTDNQVPSWLNTSNPKVRIVDHKEIIPAEYLPTFNSISIEHCICNIKDLSEYFLYACDDMFFYNYVSPSFFFTKNKFPIIRYGTKLGATDTLFTKALYNADNLVKNRYNFSTNRYPHHNIDAYRKSDVINCRNEFLDDLMPTISSRYRTINCVERTIYSNYALAIKHGELKIVQRYIPSYKFYKYIPLLRKTIRVCNEHIPSETVWVLASDKRYYVKLKNNKTKLFCINDDEITTNENRTAIHNFLENLLPQKSSFEF